MSTQRYYSGIVKIFTLLVGLLSFTSQVIAKDYTISVFVDSSFKNHDDWVERYQENLKNLNKVYGKYAIHFNDYSIHNVEIDTENFTHKIYSKIGSLRKDNDFAIMFSGKKVKLNCSTNKNKYSAIVVRGTKRDEQISLIHQVGHLFGLPHMLNDDMTNYMQTGDHFESINRFTSESEEILKLTRDSADRKEHKYENPKIMYQFYPKNGGLLELERDFNIKKAKSVDPFFEKKLILLYSVLNNYKVDHTIFGDIAEISFELGDINNSILYYTKEIEYIDELNASNLDSIRFLYSHAYNYLGETYHSENKHSQARYCFQKALQNDPLYADAYNNLGKGFHELEDLPNALANYKKAIEVDSLYTDGYVGVGHVYYMQKDYSNAIKYYEKAIELHSSAATYFLIRSQAKLGTRESALKELDPKLAWAMVIGGTLLLLLSLQI